MRRNNYFFVLIMLGCIIGAKAENVVYGKAEGEIPDSILADKTVQLSEVTVSATPVIHKVDRDLYIPSNDTKSRSNDALDLLQNMQLPTLNVNTVLNTIDCAGQSVEVRINGRKVGVEQIKSINPGSVVRVEYHDSPGLRYGRADKVVDFIVRNREHGGSLMLNALQSVKSGFGNQNGDLKLNSGNSQWEVNYYGQMRLDLPVYRENIENYTFNDGSTMERIETPIGGKCDYYDMHTFVGYNYLKTDKLNAYARLYLNRGFNNELSHDGILTNDAEALSIVVHDTQRSPGFNPGLNFYLDYKIGNGQTLVFDVNGSYYKGKSGRNYIEIAGSDTISTINTLINDNNYALSAEGNYIKEWEKAKLTVGTQYRGYWNSANYEFDDVKSRSREDVATIFGEYFYNIKNKLTFSAGVALTYSNARLYDRDKSSETLLVCPRLTAGYRINRASQLRMILTSNAINPTLTQLSPVLQDVDMLQAQIGNPELTPYSSYKVRLQYSYVAKRVSGQITIWGARTPRAVMDYREWNNEIDKFVTSWGNQWGIASCGVSISPRIVVIPQWLTVSGSLMFHHDYSRGYNYKHSLNSMSGNAQIQLTHWGTTLTAMYQKGNKSLWGETIEEGETMSMIQLGYRWRGFGFNTGMFVPIGRYSRGTHIINRNVDIQRILRTKAVEQLAFVSVSYNVDWGRKSKNISRLINSEVDVRQSQSASK